MSELPQGWAVASIGELADYVSRGRSPKYVEKSALPVINQRCVRWHGVDEAFLKFIDPTTWHQWDDERYVRRNDILWNSTGTGTIGRAAFFTALPSFDRAVVDSHVTIVRAGSGVHPEYLFGFIRSPAVQDKIKDMQTGSTNQVELNRSKIVSTLVPIAPLAEQDRIVAKVDGLTARTARARRELDCIPALIAHYKQRLLALAYSGELTASWRKLNAHSLTEARTQNVQKEQPTELGKIPIGWRWKSFGEMANVTGGLTKNKSRENLKNRVPYLRVGNVYADELRLDELAEIGCTGSEFAKTQLLAGDLLIVEGNGSIEQLGRVAMWNDEIKGCSHQNHIIRARPKADLVSRYGLYWLMSPGGRSAIEGVASSTSGLHTLSITKVKAFPIPVCDWDEQVEIARRIESAFGWLDRMSADYAAAISLLPKLDAAILAKAFSGELVPQNPEDEPADVVLGRIKADREAEGKKSKGSRARKSNGSKEQLMAEKALPPRDQLMKDSKTWPEVGLPFEAIAIRNSMPHDTLRDALFELLSGPSPALRQRFDTEAETIMIQRVSA